ncbi:hypothetical protein P20652_3509 [Pseudoalteromonas sp. BSi20652]|nr:hypothetical protein P20652_3509 [Pseudoalteromonas sp. BSi20652]
MQEKLLINICISSVKRAVLGVLGAKNFVSTFYYSYFK